MAEGEGTEAERKRCRVCGMHLKTRRPRCPLDGGELEVLSDPLLGRVIDGRYHISKKLDAGGMGSVYLAVHQPIGRMVAVKVLLPALARQRSYRDRFLREAQAANRINHPHVVEVTDYGETGDGFVYLVMEFLEGRTLAELLAKGPIGVGRALDMMKQLVGALARAHDLDVVHRDIKPENIFVLRRAESSDFVKLLDFGIARLVDHTVLTGQGTIMGTPGYMAPEQVRGEQVGPAADLYSLGCLLFHMLAGRPPFEGVPQRVLHAHLHEMPPRLSDLLDEVPTSVEGLTHQLLAKSPAGRPRDAHVLLSQLDLVARAHPREARMSARPSAGPRALVSFEGTEIGARREATIQDRVAYYETLLGAAGAAAKADAWVGPTLATISGRLEGIARRRREVDALSAEAAAQIEERERRSQQLQSALDELTASASSLDGQREEALASQTQLTGAREEAMRALFDALPAGSGRPDPEALEAGVRRLRTQAQALSRCETQLQELQGQRDDLGFQITQVKGRIAMLQQESEGQRHDTGRALSEVEAEIEEQLAALEPDLERLVTFEEAAKADTEPSA